MSGATLDGRAQVRSLLTHGVWAETLRRSQPYNVCGNIVLSREDSRSKDPVASLHSSFVRKTGGSCAWRGGEGAGEYRSPGGRGQGQVGASWG